jgi:hypothetical protein
MLEQIDEEMQRKYMPLLRVLGGHVECAKGLSPLHHSYFYNTIGITNAHDAMQKHYPTCAYLCDACKLIVMQVWGENDGKER